MIALCHFERNLLMINSLISLLILPTKDSNNLFTTVPLVILSIANLMCYFILLIPAENYWKGKAEIYLEAALMFTMGWIISVLELKTLK